MNNAECPYCCHEFEICDIESDNFDEECPNCGEEFEVYVEYDPIITAKKIEYKTCIDCGKEFRSDGISGLKPKKYKDLNDEEYSKICKRCFFREYRDDMNGGESDER